MPKLAVRTPFVALLCGATALGLDGAGAGSGSKSAREPAVAVAPSVETDPIPKRSGELDDPALWIHPSDPARSRVIGTLKKAGLAVYDLEGNQLQHLAGGRMNNVDLRHGFELAGRDVALVLASNTEAKRGHVAAFTIGAEGVLEPYDLELIEPDPPLRKPIYGLCMYRSPYTG